MKNKPTAITAVFFIWSCFSSLASGQNADWPLPGGQAGGGHFSTATKITPENVSQLQTAWTHRSGDFRKGANFRDGLKSDTALAILLASNAGISGRQSGHLHTVQPHHCHQCGNG